MKSRILSNTHRLPHSIQFMASRILQKYSEKKRLHNIYKTQFDRNVLISLLTFPFIYPYSYRHTNYLETQIIGKVFCELGFNVDVLNYEDDSPIDYDKYQVMFGYGYPVNNYYLHSRSELQVIVYNTGRHHYVQNPATLVRVQDFYQKRGVSCGIRQICFKRLGRDCETSRCCNCFRQ